MPANDSFLAAPGDVADWRLVVLLDAAGATGVLDALPATGPDAAAAAGLDAEATTVLLDALVPWSVTTRDAGGVYRRGPEAPAADDWPGLRHHARALRQWATTVEDRMRARDVAPDRRPPFPPEQFLAALGARAREAAPALVDACLRRFAQARTALDLGGGHGEYALELARRGLAVTMQDRPEMIDVVRDWANVEAGGVTLFAGDFFEALPAGPFDLILAAGVTHTFDAARNASLYPRLRALVPDGGGLAISTFLRRRDPVAMIFAVQMLVNGAGGTTHGEDEYRSWLGAGGFHLEEIVDLDDRGQSLLVAPAAARPPA